MSTDAHQHVHQPLDSAVHHALLKTIIDRGRAPTCAELRASVTSSKKCLQASLVRLEANHGVVLHPFTVEPWVVHPFSTTPTLFTVAAGERRWWAPCIWCACGVATLVADHVDETIRIVTLLGGETERCEIAWDIGVVAPTGLVAHFPIPVAAAWDNVHRHCACTLVFAAADDVDPWCERHGIARGEIVSVQQVADLARVWYGRHLDPDWRKPTAAEAGAMFEQVGLTGPHWHVPGDDERF